MIEWLFLPDFMIPPNPVKLYGNLFLMEFETAVVPLSSLIAQSLLICVFMLGSFAQTGMPNKHRHAMLTSNPYIPTQFR